MGTNEQKQDDTIDKIGSFFRRQSTSIKQKYEKTDFKGGAKDLGQSTKSAFQRTGSKISQGFRDLNK